jgi:hypothetical protein
MAHASATDLSSSPREATHGHHGDVLGASWTESGWLVFDRGDVLAVRRCWDAAIVAAEGIEDEGLRAASFIYSSYAAAQRNDQVTAWQLVHNASSLIRDDVRAAAWTTSRLALLAGYLGETGLAR